jgi:sigma-E factor negative regulatory protein RseC
MNRVAGTVVAALDGRRVVVACESSALAACAACAAGRGCGAGARSGGSRLTLTVPPGHPLPAVGEQVEVQAPVGGLLRAAAWLYLPPLAGLLLGPLLLRVLGVGDGGLTLAAAAAGLLAGMLAARAGVRGRCPAAQLSALRDDAP